MPTGETSVYQMRGAALINKIPYQLHSRIAPMWDCAQLAKGHNDTFESIAWGVHVRFTLEWRDDRVMYRRSRGVDDVWTILSTLFSPIDEDGSIGFPALPDPKFVGRAVDGIYKWRSIKVDDYGDFTPPKRAQQFKGILAAGTIDDFDVDLLVRTTDGYLPRWVYLHIDDLRAQGVI